MDRVKVGIMQMMWRMLQVVHVDVDEKIGTEISADFFLTMELDLKKAKQLQV
jgi:hypothetical protein